MSPPFTPAGTVNLKMCPSGACVLIVCPALMPSARDWAVRRVPLDYCRVPMLKIPGGSACASIRFRWKMLATRGDEGVWHAHLVASRRLTHSSRHRAWEPAAAPCLVVARDRPRLPPSPLVCRHSSSPSWSEQGSQSPVAPRCRPRCSSSAKM